MTAALLLVLTVPHGARRAWPRCHDGVSCRRAWANGECATDDGGNLYIGLADDGAVCGLLVRSTWRSSGASSETLRRTVPSTRRHAESRDGDSIPRRPAQTRGRAAEGPLVCRRKDLHSSRARSVVCFSSTPRWLSMHPHPASTCERSPVWNGHEVPRRDCGL